MATDTTYNGWANYETWSVALWLGNDEGMYQDAIRFGRRELSPGEVTPSEERATALFCRNIFGDKTPDGAELDNVDWEEIVKDIREMAGIEDEEEDEANDEATSDVH